MRPAAALLLLLSSALLPSAAAAQTVSTMCQAVEVPVSEEIRERALIGCGEGFPDNLLWHLDRADSIRGVLDGHGTRTLTGRGALIYFIDYSGILAEHDEFARPTGSNILAGGEEAQGSWTHPPREQPNDVLVWSHSTGVASVAIGRTTGVAPDAKGIPVLTAGDFEETLRIILGYAFKPTTPDVRTAIVNFSGGIELGDPHQPEAEALMRRMTTGVNAQGEADPNGKRFLFVLAAGNVYHGERTHQCTAADEILIWPTLLAPATEGIVSVGGIDRGNRYWAGSCTGAEVAGPAPDMLVASIGTNASYRYKPTLLTSGTSWATPYVSGVAALLLEQDPVRTPAQLEGLLKASPSHALNGTPVPVLPGTTEPEPLTKRRVVRR